MASIRRLSRGFFGSNRVVLSLSLVISLAAGCSDATGPEPWERGDILERLNGLPGVTAMEIQPYYGYPRAFQLEITQPVDHSESPGSHLHTASLPLPRG